VFIKDVLKIHNTFSYYSDSILSCLNLSYLTFTLFISMFPSFASLSLSCLINLSLSLHGITLDAVFLL